MLALTLPLACTSLAAQQIPLHGDVTDSYVRPTAILSNGTYHGRYSVEYGQDFFLGVPFAQPPIGDLRFATPRSLNTSFTEPRNATAYGPECIGYGYDQWILGNRISEDCLTINIVRPSGTEESDDLPVAVWIHGGVCAVLRLCIHLTARWVFRYALLLTDAIGFYERRWFRSTL